MPTRNTLNILSSWLNYILINNIAIIANILGVIFQCKQSQQFYLYTIYYTIYPFMST